MSPKFSVNSFLTKAMMLLALVSSFNAHAADCTSTIKDSIITVDISKIKTKNNTAAALKNCGIEKHLKTKCNNTRGKRFSKLLSSAWESIKYQKSQGKTPQKLLLKTANGKWNYYCHNLKSGKRATHTVVVADPKPAPSKPETKPETDTSTTETDTPETDTSTTETDTSETDTSTLENDN